MRSQAGQIMPVSLFGTALIALTMLAVFSTGQVSTKKQRLNDAADAAAYSAAVFQARSLNSVAYTNRAMIANQVFIGQMVSLANYFSYWDRNIENLEQVPPLKPFVTPISEVLTSVSDGIDLFVGFSARTTNAVNGLLSNHQKLVAQFGGVQTKDTVERVLSENDPDIVVTQQGDIWLDANIALWRSYMERKYSKEDLIAKGRMINDSRDDFTNKRDYEIKIVLEPSKMELEKLGYTELSWEEDGEDVSFRWDALDILSLTRKKTGLLSFETVNALPLGWSRRSFSSDDSKYECPTFRDCDRDDYHRKHQPTGTLSRENNNESVGGGLKVWDYHELREQDEYDPRFAVTVSVAYRAADLETADKLPDIGLPAAESGLGDYLGPELFRLETRPLGDQIEAIARAESYFRRPADRVAGRFGAERSDDEFANVWNPYWGARIVDAASERNIVRVAKGVGL